MAAQRKGRDGGAMLKNGKGGGPGHGEGKRHQQVLAFPAWVWEWVFDAWWLITVRGWVFVQEAPWNLRTQDFDWDNDKSLTSRDLHKKRFQQKVQFKKAVQFQQQVQFKMAAQFQKKAAAATLRGRPVPRSRI